MTVIFILKIAVNNWYVLQIMISVLGMAGGPLLGLFLMGMFMPCINTKVKLKINSTLITESEQS